MRLNYESHIVFSICRVVKFIFRVKFGVGVKGFNLNKDQGSK